MQVPDVEHPAFFKKMDDLVISNARLSEIGRMDVPGPIKSILKAPVLASMILDCLQVRMLNFAGEGVLHTEVLWIYHTAICTDKENKSSGQAKQVGEKGGVEI